LVTVTRPLTDEEREDFGIGGFNIRM